MTLAGGLVVIKASGVAGSGRSAGFAGLQTCGSTWSCPVCSAKIAATRKNELQEAITAAQARGWSVTMVTLTMRHHAGQSLSALWDALAYAWGKRVVAGRAWQGEREQFGVQGIIKLVEVTHGSAGWHVHVHALVFTAGSSRWSASGLGPLMFQRWRDGLLAKGLRAPSAGHGGLHTRTLTGDLSAMGEYFTKNVFTARRGDDAERLALEVARGDLKDGRMGNRTPFAILADVLDLGDVADLELWHEWEGGSKGRKQMTWTRGLRDLLLPTAPECSDEDIAAQDLGGEVLLALPKPTWARVCAERGCRRVLVEVAAVDQDGRAVRAYLARRGWPWIEVGDVPAELAV